jgi:hypothetical protein
LGRVLEAVNGSLGMPRRGPRTLDGGLGALSWALDQGPGWTLGALRWALHRGLGWTLGPQGWARCQWLGWALGALRGAFQRLGGDLGCLGEVLEALDPRLGPPECGLGLLGRACGILGGMLGGDCRAHGGDVLRRTSIHSGSSCRLAAEPVPESGRRTPLSPEVALGSGGRSLQRWVALG